MRFGEGIIVTGSAGSDSYSLVISGSARTSDSIYTDKDLYVGYNDTSADTGTIYFSDAGTSGGPSISCYSGGTLLNVDGDNYVYLTADTRISAYAPNIYLNAGLENACQLFLYGSENTKFLLSAQASTDQVLILSGCGGGPTSPNESAYGDMAFFVSGAVGSKGTASKGTALFGGDLVTSGGLYINSDSPTLTIQRKDNNNNSNIDFQGSGGTVGLRMSYIANENYLSFSTLGGSLTERMKIKDDGDVEFSGEIVLGATKGDRLSMGSVVFEKFVMNDSPSNYGFDLYDATAAEGFYVVNNSGTNRQAYLFADGITTDDIFGISTSTNGGSNWYPRFVIQQDGRVKIAPGGTDASLSDESGYLVIGNESGQNIVIDNNEIMARNNEAGAALHINSHHGVSAANRANAQVLIMSGGASTSTIGNAWDATDTNFFVSGSIDSRGTSERGTAVFGGDLVVSGNVNIEDVLRVSEYISCATDSNTSIRFNGSDAIQLRAGGLTMLQLSETTSGPHDDVLYVNPDKENINFLVYGDGASGNKLNKVFFLSGSGAESDPHEFGYTDTNFFVSGSKGSKGSASTLGTAVFGGDVVISGSLYSRQRDVKFSKYTATHSNLRFIRFNTSGVSSGTGAGNNTVIVAPADGSLISLSIRTTSAAGSTSISFHKASDGQSLPINPWTATETEVVDISSANTTYQVTFSSSTFSRGDILGISIDPTSDPNDVNVTTVWLYDFVS